ncbi:MAG: TIGR02302 family protein, partial [Beijerinckiaceae bacterium]
ETARRTLAEPPSAMLALPYGNQGEADAETVVQLQDHPWGGARVRVQLHVKDDAGQAAESEAREVTLPQRVFSNPLAKALVEQRRNIVIDPDRKDRVQVALDALLIEPERFLDKQWGAYMGLRLASDRLRKARTDAQLLAVADWLWTMALDLDDGGLSEAEKALRQAQERLKEALERNADANEIKRLTEELRRAMDRYMRELAERALRENRQADNQPRDENMRTMRPEDFRKMLEEIERLAREGKTAEAQQLLEQLRRMMENLQAQRGQRQMGERERGMNESMNELDKMTREQQQLRDRTFRDGQERRRRDQRAQRDRQQGQQPGQRGQRGQQGQQGQQGEQGEQGDQEGEGEGQSLQERQEALRQQLERLQRRMRDLGMSGEQGLADAEQAMRDAERQLGQGQENGAVGSQGRALEGLRRGMQGMAQQMQQQGEGDGTENAEGGPGGDDPNRPGQPRANSQGGDRDPLNRERNNRGQFDDGRLRMQGDERGTIGERSRRVLDELRRRLGDQERPKMELDYFERLLPKN